MNSSNGHAKRKELIVPYDEIAERGLVTSPVVVPHRFGEVADISPRHFYVNDYRILWEAQQEIHAAGARITPQAVFSKLTESTANGKTRLDLIGGQGAIARLFDGADSGSNLAYYGDIVREKYRLRELQRQALELNERISSGASLEDAAEFAAGMGKQVAAVNELELPTITSAELVGGDFKVEYYCDGILPKAQNCVGGAPPKSMKTSAMAVDLPLALATAGKFLGRFACSRVVRSLVLSAESGMGTMQETFKAVAAANKVDPAEVEGITWSSKVPQLVDPRWMQALERAIKKAKAEVMILDPLYLAMAGFDMASIFSLGATLAPLTEVCQQTGCTPFLIHHLKRGRSRIGNDGKEDRYGPPELEDLAGAGLAEWARSWVLLSRREKYLAGDPHRLWMNNGGSAGHSGLWALDIDDSKSAGESKRWDATVSPWQDAQKEKEQRAQERKTKAAEESEREHKRKTLAALRNFPQGETLTQVAKLAGLNNANAGEALRGLLGEGKVEVCQVTKGYSTHDGYKAA